MLFFAGVARAYFFRFGSTAQQGIHEKMPRPQKAKQTRQCDGNDALNMDGAIRKESCSHPTVQTGVHAQTRQGQGRCCQEGTAGCT